MKRPFIILILLCLTCVISAIPPYPVLKNTVYIDPAFNGVGDGTMAKPFKSLPVQFRNNTAYLIKGGAVLITTDRIWIPNDSIRISTYGNGVATIQGDFGWNILVVAGKDNVIENLNLTQLTSGFEGKTGVFGLSTIGGRGWVNNVHTTGGYRGINVGSYNHKGGKAYVTNCSVTTTGSDGMYMDDLDSLVVINCKSVDVARLFPTDIGGDCLQSVFVYNVTLENCFFDHSSMGGKYCYIGQDGLSVNISNSTFKSGENAACMYLGSSDSIPNSLWNVTNCHFKGGRYAMQNFAHEIIMYNCTFSDQLEEALHEAYIGRFYNCTFVNQKIGLVSWSSQPDEYKEIKNCIFYNVEAPFYGNRMVASNNLHFNTNGVYEHNYDKVMGIKSNLDPLFVDPSNYNYKLKAGSPAIDSGLTIAAVKTDINLVTRPKGNGYDIGAYEYVEGEQDLARIIIFPNPTTDGFSIEYEVIPSPFVVKIYDSKGSIVYDKPFPIGEKKLTINEKFSSGVYFIKLNTITTKIVVLNPD